MASVSADITMLQAWTRYEVYLKKENRSSRTIDDYRQKFEKHLALWHGTPLRKITRAEVLTWHGKVTKDAGAYAANGAARLGHALFAYARDELEAPDMPGRNPFRGKGLHNEEQPRETGMGTRDIRRWFDELLELQSPVLREFHWLSLLSGLRRNDVATLRWSDVSVLERAVAIRAPKGGKKRRFRAPLSHAMLRSLCRVRIAGRVMHDRQSHRVGASPPLLDPATSKRSRERRGSTARAVTSERSCALARSGTASGIRIEHFAQRPAWIGYAPSYS